ncbi:AsmA-like C-terminal region-containing protein [Rhodosalinus sp.]|uniref:AsmA family protein n=1 Tax=Rhodosalinus sp. TaxID=2047741 RepID=UPI00397850B2
MPTRRHLLIVALGAVVLAAGAAASYRALPHLVSDDRLRAAVMEHAATWSGGEIRLPEDAVVSSHRGGVLTLGNATFGGSFGGAEWQIDVDLIEARVKLVPLLRGEVEVERLTLKAPQFRLVEHDASAMAALRDLPVDQMDLPRPDGEVIVTDARFVYEGPTGRRVGFGGVDLRLAADPDSTGVLLTGGLPAGTGRLDVQGRLDDPAAVLSRQGSDARLVLRRAATTETAGTPPPQPRNDVPAAAREGQVISAVRRIAAAVGLTGMGPVAIEGRVTATPRSLGIADASVSFGGLLAEGDLSVALAGEAPPFDQLGQVARGASAAWRDAAAAIEAGAWRDAPVALHWLEPLEITLAARLRDSRLAGQSVEARRIRLEAGDGRARLDMDAAGGLGRMQGGIALGARSPDGPPRVSVDGRLEGVDMGATGRGLLTLAPPPLVSPPELPEGTLDMHIGLASSGETLGAIVTTVEGVIRADARDGSIAGTDLPLTLEGLAEGRDIMTEEDGPLIPSAGRTAFDTAQGRIDFVPGVARVSEFRIRGPRYDIDMRGEADLGIGAMRADGQARLLAELADDADRSPIVDLPFGLGGTLAAPVVAAGVPRSGDDLTSVDASEGEVE